MTTPESTAATPDNAPAAAKPAPRSVQICAIVGMQRSGTTALGRALGAAPGATYVGEIFHAVRGPEDDPGYRKFLTLPEVNFFRVREALFRSRPELSYPSDANQSAIWNHYVAELRRVTGADLTVIDIKANSVHHLNTIWHDTFARPNLFNLLARMPMPIIHIERQNLLAQTLSEMVANRRQQWHASRDSTDAPVERQSFDPQRVKQTILRKSNNARQLSRLLQTYGWRLDLQYETMFDGEGQIAEGVRAALTKLLGRDCSAIRTDLKKIAPANLADLVANPEEIVAAFRTHPLRSTVESWLGPPAAARS